MRFAAVVIFLALLVGACSQDSDVTGSTNSCAANDYMKFNRKDLKQCIDVCQKCDHGTPATCSTSCTFKGAR